MNHKAQGYMITTSQCDDHTILKLQLNTNDQRILISILEHKSKKHL